MCTGPAHTLLLASPTLSRTLCARGAQESPVPHAARATSRVDASTPGMLVRNFPSARDAMDDRVSWDRYGGDDVEAVVAMLINREHPNSVRITPSRGDGGVDILDRGAAKDGGDVVYQVKRYTAPLDDKQKGEVKASLARLLDPKTGDPRWRSLNVTEWRLVTPWDPTPEAFTWLHGAARRYAVTAHWDGLTTVEQLAAKYADVIDYYLFGGRARVQDAYTQAMALMALGGESTATLTVPEVSERIASAFKMLDHDPHYRYELRFGHGEPADPPERAGLMFSEYRIHPSTSSWHAVDVIARCAASPNARPIEIKGTLTAERDSAFAEVLQEFIDYGTPFSSPDGAYSGHFDAPGGLGGPITSAAVQLSPIADHDLGENRELRVEVLTPDDTLLAEAHVDRTERSHGAVGLRTVLTEVNGIFELTLRYNAETQMSALSVTLLPFNGKPVTAVGPALDLVASFHAPNRVRVSARHTPARLGSTDAIGAPIEESALARVQALASAVRVLCDLQGHSSTVIQTPDLEVHAHQAKNWHLVAQILAGTPTPVTIPPDQGLYVEFGASATPPTDSFAVLVPLRTRVGDQVLEFGQVRAELEAPKLVGEVAGPDGKTFHHYETPDRRVTYVMHPE